MKTKINEIYLEAADRSLRGTAVDFLSTILVTIVLLAIILTVVFLFFSIVAIARANDDQEERMEKVKHSIVVGICLAIEIVLAILIFTIFK